MAWKGLRHPNVLELLGVTLIGYRFAMVSEWMINGHVRHFLENNPDANRMELVCSVLVSYIGLRLIVLDRRRYQGTDIYARPRSGSRKSQSGTLSCP
jgi:hypothetical protein